MDGLVLAVVVLSVTSLAVTVAPPAVLNVSGKVRVPADRAPLAGRAAFASVELMLTVSLAVLITFQLASTAFTVRLKTVPAVCTVGVPVLPVALPGEELSPGARTCRRVKPPAFTVMAELLFGLSPECVTSEAVTIELPAVLNVILK